MQIQEPTRRREIVLTEEEKETLLQARDIIKELRDNMMENEILDVKIKYDYIVSFENYELKRFETITDLVEAERLFYEAYEGDD